MAHEGYHWQGQSNRFFEGWYFRITLPEIAQTFAFMYSIDDPAGGGDHSGGAVQILGPNSSGADEAYFCRTFPDVAQFWAWPHCLGFGHWRKANTASARYLQPDVFWDSVQEGYQIGAHRHVGRVRSPVASVQTESASVSWDYRIEPVSSWGKNHKNKNRKDKDRQESKATAGWLSYLPIFEPGWQVLMAHGLASGWVRWQGKNYRFEKVPAYAEKNWGGAFPAKWFWIQCNAFAGVSDLSVTAVGGVREVLAWQENVGLIGIHYQDEFYEFFSTKTQFSWRVDPWGSWQLTAIDHQYQITLTGETNHKGAWVRVPTRDGLKWRCRDTTYGKLHLRLRLRKTQCVIVEAKSHLAGLEVGGGPWDAPWIIHS